MTHENDIEYIAQELTNRNRTKTAWLSDQGGAGAPVDPQLKRYFDELEKSGDKQKAEHAYFNNKNPGHEPG